MKECADEVERLREQVAALNKTIASLRERLRETEADRDYQRSRRPKPLFPGSPEDFDRD